MLCLSDVCAMRLRFVNPAISGGRTDVAGLMDPRTRSHWIGLRLLGRKGPEQVGIRIRKATTRHACRGRGAFSEMVV
jgi:hypothetical protein